MGFEVDLFILRLLRITALARWYQEQGRDGPRPRIATDSLGEMGSAECWHIFPTGATSVVTFDECLCNVLARRAARTPSPCSYAAADDIGHLGLT